MKRIDAIDTLNNVVSEVAKVIIGRKDITEMVIMALLADGHVLLEGVPGVAKTLLVSALCKTFGGHFVRIQMVPDMLPSDIVGTEIIVGERMEIQPSPLITANFALIDEINRCPARTQAALLQAMQEREITILGKKTFELPDPFMVLATQNPIEQAGTYELPEAQIDRFLLKIVTPYNTMAEEKEMIKTVALDTRDKISTLEEICPVDLVLDTRHKIKSSIVVSDTIDDYIVRIVNASRNKFKNVVKLGASPRAIFALRDMARVRAFMNDKDYVYPEDVNKVIFEVLRHRISIKFKALTQGWTSEKIIDEIIQKVKPS